MSDSRLNRSRFGRATRIGGMAAGGAARQLGVRAANTMCSEEEAEEALGRQALEMADRIVKMLGGMKGAAMKVGQTLSVLDPGFGLVFGILGQLQTTNNWYRIGREVIFDEEPVTELGQIEAEPCRPRQIESPSR